MRAGHRPTLTTSIQALAVMGVDPVRAFLSEISGQAPATRKRKRAAVSAFCRWAVRHDRMPANPMDKVGTITVPKRLPRPALAADIYRVRDAICARRPRKSVPIDVLRDRLLFETAYQCGTRATEACGLYVEDFDLTLDDEHVRVHGKGGTVRTVLLDDRGYVILLRLYLARTGYTAGPMFRAASTGPTARCRIPQRTTGGRSTAPQPESTSTSTSCATPTPTPSS